jgi:hypothetical protein
VDDATRSLAITTDAPQALLLDRRLVPMLSLYRPDGQLAILGQGTLPEQPAADAVGKVR